MLAFIKNLFSRHPKVEVIEYSDGLLSFRSKNTLPIAPTVVRVRSGANEVDTRVDIESFDASSSIYRAQLPNADKVLSKLKLDRRDAERFTCVLRVVSPSLPLFSCTTEDVSVTGMRISLRRPVEQGKEFLVTLELDDSEKTPIQVVVEVRWCAQRADRSFHAGLRFTDLEGRQKRMLEKYLSGHGKGFSRN
ncbi:MAG: PilZ domain-containing protein [Vulcanimicrobiota bacterium]